MTEKKKPRKENVKDKQPLRARIETCAVRPAETGFEVEVTVRNEESRPIFVSVGVRQILWDEATSSVDVWFADHARDVGRHSGRCRLDASPRTRTVEPGATLAFTARLHATYTRIVAHEDQSFHVESIDLHNAQTLTAHIAVADAPFYFNPRRGAMIKQLVSWGEERSVTTTMPQRDPPAAWSKGS